MLVPVSASSGTPGADRNDQQTCRHAVAVFDWNSTGLCAAERRGQAVVAWAQAMAAALYVNPACHGQISYPNCYYTWYKAPGSTYPPGAPDFPQAVIQYGEQVCPGCSAWANGTYQCVSFVRGAYSQVYPMTDRQRL